MGAYIKHHTSTKISFMNWKKTTSLFNFSILILIYIFTRFPFPFFNPVYYDSFEYVSVLQNARWGQIVSIVRSTHQPIHTIYIGLAALIKTLAPFTASEIYIFISLIFGLVTVIFWYIFLFYFYKRKEHAFWGTALLILFPAFWRINTNILYESMLLAFQAGAFATFFLFLDKKQIRYILAAIIFFGSAQLVFIGNIFSAVPIAFMALIFKIKERKMIFIWLIASIIFSLLIDYIILGSTNNLIQKYTSHMTDLVSPQGGIIITSARIIRNIILLTSKIIHPLTLFITILAFWALRNEKRIIIITLAFFAASFVMMQYWHAGFFERIGILVIFPISILLAKFIGDRSLIGAILCIILTINIFILGFQQKKISYITALTNWVHSVLNKEKSVLFITGDYTRFTYEQTNANVFIIRDPKNETEKLLRAIINTEQNNGRVIADASALSYPFNQPDGWDYQLLSRQNKKGVIEKFLTEKCNLQEIYQQQSIPPLIIYEVKSCSIKTKQI